MHEAEPANHAAVRLVEIQRPRPCRRLHRLAAGVAADIELVIVVVDIELARAYRGFAPHLAQGRAIDKDHVRPRRVRIVRVDEVGRQSASHELVVPVVLTPGRAIPNPAAYVVAALEPHLFIRVGLDGQGFAIEFDGLAIGAPANNDSCSGRRRTDSFPECTPWRRLRAGIGVAAPGRDKTCAARNIVVGVFEWHAVGCREGGAGG